MPTEQHLLTARERDHLQICSTCKHTWDIYRTKNLLTGETADKIASSWCSMTEAARLKYSKSAQTKDNVLLRRYARRRNPSGYQLYLSESMTRSTLPTFAEKVKESATGWKSLGTELQTMYRQQSIAKREERCREIRSLPVYMRQRLRILKRELARSRRRNTPKRKCNPFMLYLRDRWNDEKRRGVGTKYRELMNTVSIEWRTLDSSMRSVYMSESQSDTQHQVSGTNVTARREAGVQPTNRLSRLGSNVQ